MPKTNLQTYIEVKRRLVDMFQREQFKHNKLPSETDLAKELQISLVTLRESLMMLALEGYITKRHGSGNYMHPSALDPTDRIDLGLTFADAFRRQGKEPGMRIHGIMTRFAEEEQRLFHLTGQDAVESMEVVYTADGLASIYSTQVIPQRNIRTAFKIGEGNTDIHTFIKERCGQEITHSLNNYKAIMAPERAAAILGIDRNVPILYCEQLFYNIKDEPVLFNRHYFHPERYGMRMLQNWDLNSSS